MTEPATAATWPTVNCGIRGCENRLRMRTIGADDLGNGGRPDYDGIMGKDDQFCSREHRYQAEHGLAESDGPKHIDPAPCPVCKADKPLLRSAEPFAPVRPRGLRLHFTCRVCDHRYEQVAP